MKANKIIAAALAVCLIGNPLFSAEYNKENLLAVSAAEVIESGKYGDNLTWTFYSDGVLEIDGTGEMMYTRGINQYPWYPHREDITKVIIAEGITSVAGRSFVGYENIAEVVVPSTMKDIDGFTSCCSLKSIELPEGLLSIGIQAFTNCDLIKTVTIPSTVTEIGVGAFEWCDALTEINVAPDNNSFVDVDGILFTKDMKTLIQYPIGKTQISYVVPSTVETIGEDAFRDAEKLENIILPDALTVIEPGALGSTGIKSIRIPEGISVINRSAFNSCKSLESIIIPSNVIKIDDLAFRNNVSLKEIVIENPSCEIYDSCATISSNFTANEFFTGTIYGFENSIAQTYAENYDYKFEPIENYYNKFKLGDVNGDEVVDGIDATLVLREYTLLLSEESGTFSDSQSMAANVNGDEKVDGIDATLILRYYTEALSLTSGAMPDMEEWINMQRSKL
ncbi:MAG: leucine-rich repeat protein [Ruminococcus sp.]|nr:leucine-rich repeat protein [Ruminococcus sp.]